MAARTPAAPGRYSSRADSGGVGGVGTTAAAAMPMDIDNSTNNAAAAASAPHGSSAVLGSSAVPPPCTPGGGITDDVLRRSMADFLQCCGDVSMRRSGNSLTSNATSTNNMTAHQHQKRQQQLTTGMTCALTRLRDKCATTVGTDGMAVVLSPATAETALRAIHAALDCCYCFRNNDTHNDNYSEASSEAAAATITTAMDFVATAFGSLEYDLVFTAMRIPVVASREDDVKNIYPFDVLSDIIFDDKQKQRQQQQQQPWTPTNIHALAITILSRGLRATEFVQRYATSTISLPISSPADSALGIGLGLDLELQRPKMECIARRMIDVVIALGDERAVRRPATTMPDNPYRRKQPAGGGGGGSGGATANDSSTFPGARCDHFSESVKETLRIASVTLLGILFRADYADWALCGAATEPNSPVETLCRVLLSQAQKYGRDQDVKTSECAASSLSLLVLLNTKQDVPVLDEQRIFDSNTIDCILSSAFPSSGSRLPSRAKDESVGRIASNLLADLAFANGEGYATIVDHLPSAIDKAWPILLDCNSKESILDQRIEGLENVLMSLLCLHNSSRTSVRRTLKNFLGVNNVDALLTDEDTPVTYNTQHRSSSRSQTVSCDKMLTSLLLLARHDCFGVSSLAVGLLRALLDKPQGQECYDDLGRSLWASIEQSAACTSEANKFIQNTTSLLRYIVSPEFVECINGASSPGHLASGDWRGDNPVFVRFEARLCFTLDTMGVLATSNNFVSQLRSCVEDDVADSTEEMALYFFPCRESPKSNLLRAITLAGATILGRAVGSKEVNGPANKTQSEIRKVLRRVMYNQDEQMDAIGDCVSHGTSCDLTLRIVRLQRLNGEILDESDMSAAISIFSACSRARMDMQRSKEAAMDAESELKRMADKIQSMRTEHNNLSRTVESLRASNSLNTARAKAEAEANARDSQQLLAEEKEQAVDQAREYRSRMVEAEEKCRDANAREEDARRNLDQAKAAISELSQRFEALEIQAQDEHDKKVAAEEELQEIRQEYGTIERELQERTDDLEDVNKEHRDVRDALQVAESSNVELRQEMENAYGRLVSLANLFQIKEDELNKANSSHRDALQRAHREADESSRKTALAEDTADAFENENKELKRKLEKTRKELEKEKSSKATGPVGYFNRLHEDYEKKHDGRDRERRERYRSGNKENDRDRASSRSRPSSRTREGSQR
eukprot:CAMPEP_0178501956 /NCGR_PEP_ID=MMETSP0696-20121128/17244_1 /TAXON_ID=265572 /ORGANISM="Extubocellulus spinifer, Strain CCMP396" /LENGTH=1199 /DNA_ID=CAMNT_0020130975 /DNA_START=32 /DNA_END=3628 /DNA_ORIENTATION=+